MTEAGWYEDPEGHGRGRRYWDGSSWTEHYEHAAASQAPAQQAPAVQQQQPAQQLPPAGWKDDPEGGPGMRYWDGSQWTDHYHPPRDTAQQPAAGGFQPAGQAFQPSTGEEPAAAASSGQQVSSLDETQLDVRGYHGGRDDAEASDAVTAEPEAASTPEVADAPEAEEPEPAADSTPEPAPVDFGDDRTTTDYGNAGDTAFCENCGARIRSSHKFCPACGHKQEGLPG